MTAHPSRGRASVMPARRPDGMRQVSEPYAARKKLGMTGRDGAAHLACGLWGVRHRRLGTWTTDGARRQRSNDPRDRRGGIRTSWRKKSAASPVRLAGCMSPESPPSPPWLSSSDCSCGVNDAAVSTTHFQLLQESRRRVDGVATKSGPAHDGCALASARLPCAREPLRILGICRGRGFSEGNAAGDDSNSRRKSGELRRNRLWKPFLSPIAVKRCRNRAQYRTQVSMICAVYVCSSGGRQIAIKIQSF